MIYRLNLDGAMAGKIITDRGRRGPSILPSLLPCEFIVTSEVVITIFIGSVTVWSEQSRKKEIEWS